MHPQLMLLLEIQDLHLQRTALLEEPGGDRMEANHFNIEPEVAARTLEEKIEELMEGLDPAIQQRCARGLPSLGRMVVPVIGGVCYGCFVSIPTARSGEVNQAVQTCESCGRFIYILK
jgi:predicted  nucleic acid-binding Zn-ribbon protein